MKQRYHLVHTLGQLCSVLQKKPEIGKDTVVPEHNFWRRFGSPPAYHVPSFSGWGNPSERDSCAAQEAPTSLRPVWTATDAMTRSLSHSDEISRVGEPWEFQ